MSAEAIYDFEHIIPAAIAKAFEDGGLEAGTTDDDPDFQKPRPRTEIMLEVGSEESPRRLFVMPDGTTRNSTWSGIVSFHILTDASPDGKLSGGSYRSQVRNLLAGIYELVNSTTLTTHAIGFVGDLGTSYGINTEKGFEVTRIQHAIKFSIQADAWAQLTA